MKLNLKSFLAGVAVTLLVVCGLWLVAGGDDDAVEGSTPTTEQPETTTRPAPAGFDTIEVGALPSEARQTLTLIDRGGPYPYRADDGVFQNREGLLPDHQRGFYREYTVETPGSPDRGARRIVTGERGEAYYTDDHYDSFWWVLR